LWLLVAVVPVSVGAGLIRPSLNSLMTRCVRREHYGGVLGLSASFVSAANALAPLMGGLIFQHYGSTMPFLLGGIAMGALAVISLYVLRPSRLLTQPQES
jgi:MFS transporter, DHA1 family, tetracycline resistance protein